jgi:SAM-dependent methyltransferase
MAEPPSLDDVLVIGAGGGNDVAAALAKDAGHVDAVEIDPKLYELGKERHPNAPYDDPRVSVHIDDGRAFLERTDRSYDLILLALPDSLTLVSGQSSLRLESYLFTEEALTSAREHLRPGGVFVMYNYYREDWLADRFAKSLQEVYGSAPCQMSLGSGDARFSLLASSDEPSSLDCSTTAPQDGGEPHAWEATVRSVPDPATDDHPFPYLRSRRLTTFYLTTIALILGVSVLMVRAAAGPLRPMLRYADLFFMGVAFLLLETKSVVQFALLFGTTWFVNALVFLGVLLSVLLAVAVSRRMSFRRPALLYVVLLASLVIAWLVPLDELLDLSVGPRFVVAVLLAFFPIFTANLVFTQRFKSTASSTTAFGANLLGAMVGGLVEYSALVIGYRMLLVVAAVVYGLAFLAGRRHLAAPAPA